MAAVFSALGCCLAEVGLETVRTCRRRLADDTLPELARTADELVAGELRRLGHRSNGVEANRWLELRYLGQNAELGIPWSPGASASDLRRAFDDAHRREYGFDSTDAVEVVAVRCRLRVAGDQEWPVAEADGSVTAETAMLLLADGRRTHAKIVGLARLRASGPISGPALVAAQFGSITVCPGQTARLDDDENVVLEAG
jgi:5-oxoprolinase (ATP-hydrolysing)